MAKLSPRKRLQLGIDRIKRTGWTTGSMRDDGYWQREQPQPVKDRRVCLLGALHTDKEYATHKPVTSFPGICGAVAALVAVIPDVAPVQDENCARQVSYLISWNDDLIDDHTGKGPSKQLVMRKLKAALKQLDTKKGAKNASNRNRA